MQLALREITRLRVSLVIWAVVTAVAAVAGPFGTHAVMGTVGLALYWGGVSGASILLNFGAIHLAEGRVRWQRIAVWVGFVLLVSLLAHGVNSFLFEAWGGIADWAYLAGTVGLVTVAVHAVMWAVVPDGASEGPDADAFLRRLPIDLRAPLVRIEAQDHYLNVVTVRGRTLILMRLGDAAAELSRQGLRVHRSHWVATDGVVQHRRAGARDVLVMADGAQVPVSRSFRAAARAAGLF